MARIRTVKPELLDDEKTAGMSDAEWRLFVSMWLVADDQGRLRGTPDFLRGRVFWRRAGVDVEVLLAQLVALGVIHRYVVDGQAYIAIVNWSKHQKIDRPTPSRIPAPCADSSRALATNSRALDADLDLDLDLDLDQDLGPRTRTKNSSPISSGESAQQGLHLDPAGEKPDPERFDFATVYAGYPRKAGRKKGLQRCRSQITTRAKYDALVAAVKNYAASVAGSDPQYVKHFDTFLNCWEDFVVMESPTVTTSRKANGFTEPMAAATETRTVRL